MRGLIVSSGVVDVFRGFFEDFLDLVVKELVECKSMHWWRHDMGMDLAGWRGWKDGKLYSWLDVVYEVRVM